MSSLSPFLLLWLVLLGVSAQVPSPNAVTRESTTTATVDRIERASRVVTLRGEGNVFQTVYVEQKITAFDTLKVGDVVTVRYTESVIVQVRRNAKPTPAQDTTEEARKAGDEHVLEQLKIVVTIENIDPQRLSSPTVRTTISEYCTLSGTRPYSMASVRAIGWRSRGRVPGR